MQQQLPHPLPLRDTTPERGTFEQVPLSQVFVATLTRQLLVPNAPLRKRACSRGARIARGGPAFPNPECCAKPLHAAALALWALVAFSIVRPFQELGHMPALITAIGKKRHRLILLSY